MSYLNGDDNGTIIRRCCSDNCKIEDGYKAYSCSEDQCNGIHSDRKLLVMKNKISQKRIILKRTAEEQESSLSCYDCSGHSPNCGVDEATVVQGCRACLVYLNTNDNNNVIRTCCRSNCGSPGTIGDYDGRTAYFCSSNRCNGIGAEDVLTGEAELASTTTTFPALSSATTTTMTTTVQTSFSCYDCSGSNEQQCTTTSSNCPMCTVQRNENDPTKFDRRCCWWACGPPNQVTDYNSRPTYFCNADKCNGPGSEAILGYATTTSTAVVPSTIISTTSAATATTQQTSSKCYDCSGPDCGKEGSNLAANCPTCIVYRNPNDQTKIERRCCWWGCDSSNTIGNYNGLETYFCTGDKCNGYGVESALSPLVTTTIAGTASSTRITTMTTTASSTRITTMTATASSTGITTMTTQQTSFKCYECSGPDCGKEGSTASTNCPTCIVYRNPTDQTKIERRCCWWGCGPSNTIGNYNGLETYFCTGDKCNGYGVESALSPLVTTTIAGTASSTRITTMTATASSTRITTMTATASSTGITTMTTQQTSFKCYECSGPDCGKEGSTVSTNCPTCIVYRNPTDQTKIERRCCWWGCGPSNTIGNYNGLETYFCTGDKCNGYGVESALSPPVTTTTANTMTTSVNTISQMTTTTSSSSSCVLNCQNGSTPETEDGCFCYCLDNTNGRECENVDCAQLDVDSETCSSENQPLCEESETFALECLHLCGKC